MFLCVALRYVHLSLARKEERERGHRSGHQVRHRLAPGLDHRPLVSCSPSPILI